MRKIKTIDLDTTNYQDIKRDQPAEVEFKLQNNIVRIKRGGPFGHWTISYEKGRTPVSL